jgi:hypothetical protein
MRARTRRGIRAAVWTTWALAIAGGIVWKMPAMSPVHEGTVEEFWWCALHLAEDRTRFFFMGEAYTPREGWFVYYDQSLHDQHLFRVGVAAVAATLPDTLARLERAVKNDECPGYVARGFHAWQNGNPNERDDPAALLAHIRTARLAELGAQDSTRYGGFLIEEEFFEVRWRRFTRYWLNAVFEFCFLFGLTFFAVGPWTRFTNASTLALRCALVPFLFFLPYFLGYATWTFTSRGPSGGILYPWLLAPFRNLHGWCGDEEWVLLEIFPSWLVALSQPNGSFLSISGLGYVGPFTVLTLGLGLAILVLLVLHGIVTAQKRTARRRAITNPSLTPQ